MKNSSHIKWNRRGYDLCKDMLKETKSIVLFAMVKTADKDYFILSKKLDSWFLPVEEVFYDLFNRGTSIGKIRLVLAETGDRLNALDKETRKEIYTRLHDYRNTVKMDNPMGSIFYDIFLNTIKEVA